MAHVAPPPTPRPVSGPNPSVFQDQRAFASAVSLADRPFFNVLAGVAYLTAFWWVYINYLSVVWGYTGLFYRPISWFQAAFVYVSVGVVAYYLPSRLRTPSALILWMLFTFVYTPTMAQTMMLGEKDATYYLPSLGALTIAMAAAGAIARRSLAHARSRAATIAESLVPSVAVTYGLIITFALTTLVLVYVYRSIMNFADITSSDDVYATRFAASDITGGLLGYVRAYYNYVLSPAVMAVGLAVPRFRWFVAAAMVGFIVSYMIDASKISLIIPIGIFGVWAILRYGRASVGTMTGSMGAATLFFGWLAERVSSLSFFADLVLFRSIAIPGQQFALYYDLFSSRGYTFWSNVRGISLIVPPPASFVSDPRWPVLGQIVGEEYYGFSSRTNSNANLFAGEGVAAAGPLGVLVIGLALVIYLRVLDRAAYGWDRGFVLYALAPVGFALTNVHLSTTLVSFGGAFWVLFLLFLRPSQTSPATGLPHPVSTPIVFRR